MGFIALKEIRIKTDDGRYVLRKPGEAVPEADGWKNLDYWVRAKHVGPAEEVEAVGGEPVAKKAPARRKVKATRKVAKKGARRVRA